MEAYKPIEPTKTQIACNAIRDMFFHRRYKGVIPTSDIKLVKNSKHWHRIYGKEAVTQAIKQLSEEGYINLDPSGENWLWGGDMHEMLFPKE